MFSLIQKVREMSKLLQEYLTPKCLYKALMAAKDDTQY